MISVGPSIFIVANILMCEIFSDTVSEIKQFTMGFFFFLVNSHNQPVDYSATFQVVWRAKKNKEKKLNWSQVCFTPNTEVSGVLAVTVYSLLSLTSSNLFSG